MRKIASFLALALILTLIASCAMAQDTYFGLNHGKGLRLRSAASYDSKVIKNYRSGTWVEILEEVGTFYHVYTEDGYEGYMDMDYITVINSDDEGMWATIENGSKFVNVRAEDNNSCPVIDRLHTGDRVEILSTGRYYDFVRIDGEVLGYISNAFLRVDGQEIIAHTQIYTTKGSTVHLRSGPSTRYDIIGSYPTGSSVSVLVKGANWYKVKVGSQVGYMAAEYLQKPVTPHNPIYSGDAAPAIGTGAIYTGDTAPAIGTGAGVNTAPAIGTGAGVNTGSGSIGTGAGVNTGSGSIGTGAGV